METQNGAGPFLHAGGYRDPVARSVPDPNSMRADQRVFHPDGICDELLVGDMWVKLGIGVPYRTGGPRPRI